MSKFIPLLILALLFTSCDEKKTIYIASSLTDCQGENSQKCMQVKENKEDDWTLFYDQIEGFDYKEGFTYKLEVNISKIENPPADGSSLKYKLIKVIYQEKNQEANLSGKWKVEVLNNFNDLSKNPTLTFKDGKISGNAGCNSYGSSFQLDGNKISFGMPNSTKMMCPSMDIERAFFNYLSKANSYKVKDGKLIIYSKENVELIKCVENNI